MVWDAYSLPVGGDADIGSGAGRDRRDVVVHGGYVPGGSIGEPDGEQVLALAGAPIVPVPPHGAGPDAGVGREGAVAPVDFLRRRPLDVARDDEPRAVGQPNRIEHAVGETRPPRRLAPRD